MLSNLQSVAAAEIDTSLSGDDDYSCILQTLGLEYKPSDYYWQVGEITKTQGWILHLSVVLSQIRDMLENIIPVLIKENVPFKIAMTELTAEDILNGNFGFAKIGKIVSIYPHDDAAAIDLAKRLVELTKSYNGPNILTDIRLGSIVYTRYGSFNPVIKLSRIGTEEKYIYNGDLQLIKDPYAIPFQLPKGIIWPFAQLTEPRQSEPPKLLNRLYKLIDILKPDPRGNVFKGLYVKGLLQVKQCVIKQGFNGMSSDKAGRDIQDRLIWQHELYKELSDIVPLPVVYDLFTEQNSTVLVMEFIKGDSLFDKQAEINPLSKCWPDLPVADACRLLSYALNIVKIIDQMHRRGYVHRDVVPVNFLINKKDEIILIDVELAYSLNQNMPCPPFKLGTFGFMSPEQAALQHPTIFEDIYGLGATLMYMFTGIFPVKFNTNDTKTLSDNLHFFIGNKEVAKMIADCTTQHPLNRPPLPIIQEVLTKYQKEVKANLKSSNPNHQDTQSLNRCTLAKTIDIALNGLNKAPIVTTNKLWYSKQVNVENYAANKNKQYSVTPGIVEGICGPLYVLARIREAGISIDSCLDEISKGWKFIENNYFNRLTEISSALYLGSAGIAMALAQSLRGGLQEDNSANKQRIYDCFDKAADGINLANGIAGQGLSILHCRAFIEKEAFESRLNEIIDNLLSQQREDGSWLKSTGNCMDIGFDDTGILCFLMESYSLNRNQQVRCSIIRGLIQLTKHKKNLKHLFNLLATQDSYELGDGGKGLIFSLIRAYEILKEDKYKSLAEDAFSNYPYRINNNNFSQQSGLAAIGELYLEAWRVFKNEEWKHRAEWIANVFIHSLYKTGDDVGHWIMEQNNPPTADFLMGNSGIIHFLARCLYPDKIQYRLLR